MTKPLLVRFTLPLCLYLPGCVNRLDAIPPEKLTMRPLNKLQVSKNNLTELPDAIGNLTELRYLNLADKRIEALPDIISRLTRLRHCHNPIKMPPAGFAEMPGSIDITGTQVDIESLPPAHRA